MRKENEPKYFFRGTTKGFAGNGTTADIDITCTSENPAKALFFAYFCSLFSRETVVYMAKEENLEDIEKVYNKKANRLRILEEETGFHIKPKDFYRRCEGYLSSTDVAKILGEVGIHISPCFSLSDCLEQIGPMSQAQIEKFWDAAMNKIADNKGLNLAKDLGIGDE